MKEQGMIGLEIHVYLITKEKLFCRCRASREKGLMANSLICEICTGQPGAKPMLPNKAAVEKGVQVALMLGCRLNKEIKWMRKHYSWPDLPKGYQNTLSGARALPLGERGNFQGIRIREIHIEEDPASWDPETGKVDYNRSGLPLIEIVTEPDFSASEEVTEWLKRLLHNLEYLKAVSSDAGIKADVNVNLAGTRKTDISKGEKALGATERVEIKNVNSIENIGLAIDYELERQTKEGSVKETRRFDAISGKTIRMRGKEEQEDYRFIIDPDLQELILNDEFIQETSKKMPEPPEVKLENLIKKYKIRSKDAEVLAKNLEIVEFFEQTAQKIDGKFALPWIAVELLRHLNFNKKRLDELDIKVGHFVELLEAVKSGRITEQQGKKILDKFYPKSFSLREQGFEGKINDREEIKKICEEIIKENKECVEKYKKGDLEVFNFLIGQVMAKSKGRADFRIVREILENILK